MDYESFYLMAEQAQDLEETATAKWHLIDAMTLDRNLSGAPVRIGVYIVKRLFSYSGYLRISRERIAEDLGITVRTVSRGIKKLEGYIVVHSQRGKVYSGNYFSNEYTVDWLYWNENEWLPQKSEKAA